MFDNSQWAQCPPIQHKGDGESYGGQEEEKRAWNFEATDRVSNSVYIYIYFFLVWKL